ncbi:hypothetical protein SAMN06269185_0360 [Natronoarchaeum philippinense]|uniref:Uncharacterized protein n=1 Tax=Natronoarchaeum philippinense TaxID=558529 RepID=A0A285N2U1_NATPI|nr:hypothetical protein [Natronoarchaeum philippinense]SNZ03749.1 hypothetical protein SAMN06269185_0360 [Natronoarchaeum philippinense]
MNVTDDTNTQDARAHRRLTAVQASQTINGRVNWADYTHTDRAPGAVDIAAGISTRI